MAFVVPLVATFVAGGGTLAGVAALATSGLAGFATVAGGVLSSIGALTGSKDLMKVGAVLGIGGAIGGAVGGAAGQGAAASTEVADAMRAAEHGTANLTSATAAPALGQGLNTGADLMNAGQTAEAATQGLSEATQGLNTPATMAGDVADKLSSQTSPILGRGAEMNYGSPDLGSNIGAGQIGGISPGSQGSGLEQWAAGKTSDQIGGILSTAWDKTKALAGNVGASIKDNPEAWKLGGGILQGMYGPQAEQADLMRKRYEQENGILMRRIRNLASPISLGDISGGVK